MAQKLAGHGDRKGSCCDEYCSNYGCNQGRDCPVRVATYRPVMRAADPLPPSLWRIYLRYLAKWMLILFFMLLIIALGAII